jgi:diguanylate cyclase (GGDEF)-like protein
MPNFFRLINQHLYWLMLLGILLLSPVVYMLYAWQVDEARNQEFQFYQSSLIEKVDVLIKEKQNTTQALAVAMTSPPNFKNALLNGDPDLQKKLAHYTHQLKTLTKYKGVWIQLVDKNGVSLARSWTTKKGDNLTPVRKDIASMIENPRRINNFSVGKFALTFKSMVPIFDDNDRFLGMVDVISQIDSIDQALSEMSHVHSVVLVDKRYRKQLTNAFTGKFIDDYYVANIDATEPDIALIERYGVERAFKHSGYMVFDGYLVVTRHISDLSGQPMATWVTLKPLDSFEFIHVYDTQKQFIVMTLFIVLLLIFLLAMMYFKRQAELEKRFFFEVFDTSTEIVYVSNHRRILFANRRFFEFFDTFQNVEEFHQSYHCICELFVPEESYLRRYMDGTYWFDYVVENKDKSHYAKIRWHDRDYIFLVKATDISSHFGTDYVSVLMTDITEEEHYKSRLEHLIVHDELTGVHNRHYFNQYLQKVMTERPNPFCMVFLDVDHFKQVNDAHGHDMGDKVLVEVAQTLKSLLRARDEVCRVGGEEFAVMLPDTQLESALILAERYREAVADLAVDKGRLSVTISLGVVQLQADDSLQSFYKRADRALYLAKQQGRNRVEIDRTL